MATFTIEFDGAADQTIKFKAQDLDDITYDDALSAIAGAAQGYIENLVPEDARPTAYARLLQNLGQDLTTTYSSITN